MKGDVKMLNQSHNRCRSLALDAAAGRDSCVGGGDTLLPGRVERFRA
jgi:hypothetical protein